MGILSAISNFFGGGEDNNSRLPSVHQNAITPETFTPNQEYLYTSSELVREGNNRGWVIDDELVSQSKEIATNAKKNAKNVKKFGKNIKDISKAELLTAKEMSKIIKITSDGDAKKYGIVTDTQAGLDAQDIAYATIKTNYKERLKATNQSINQAMNGSQNIRDRLKGGN